MRVWLGIVAVALAEEDAGGGDIDLERVWESLTNNTDKPNVKINVAHIPDITVSKVSDIEAWIVDKGYLTNADLSYYLNMSTTRAANTVLAGPASGSAAAPTFRALTVADIPLDNRLSYVDPNAGEDVTIEDTGETGTVLWGAESAYQVYLDVNGTSKALLKPAALDNLITRIGTLEGYFTSGKANNALQLNGHDSAYFATASALNSLSSTVAGLVTGVSSVVGQTGVVTTSQIASALTGAGYELTDTTYSAASANALGLIKIGAGLTIDEGGVVSVTGQTHGTVTRVDIGSTQYAPDASGVVGLPAYPTSLPASDVYAWAKAATKPSYSFSELTSHPTTISGYGITDAKFGTAGSDYIPITLGSTTTNVLTAHQSLAAYATQTWVTGLINTTLSSVLKWVGETTTDIVTNPIANPVTIDGASYTAVAGNVVSLYGTSKEFRFDGTRWKEMGDEASYAYKTITITGTGYLTGGGTLEADRTIDIASTYKTYIGEGHTAYGWGNHADAGYFLAANFTQSNIQSTLGISYWALAANKPSYAFSEITGTATAAQIPSLTVSKISDFPATWALANITDADDLKAIEALAGTSGLLRKTAANTWELDTSIYLTSISLLGYVNELERSEASSANYVQNITKAGSKLTVTRARLGNITIGSLSVALGGSYTTENMKSDLDFNLSLIGDSASYDTTDLIVVN